MTSRRFTLRPRSVPIAVLLCALPLLSSATGPPAVEASALTPTFGGVLLTASFNPRGRDVLSGVWYDGGRAKLMRCDPHCTVVTQVPLDSPIMVSQHSLYRVVLAGKFKTGQRLKMVLRFNGMQLVTLSVPVTH